LQIAPEPRSGIAGIAVNLANRITFLRLFLIPVFIGLVLSYDGSNIAVRNWATGVFIVAALSDLVDGMVARRYQQRTKLGTMLDPLADKLMINLSFIFLAVHPVYGEVVPQWLAGLVILRDSVIIVGAYGLNRFLGPIKPKPRILGKIATWAHSIAIVGVVAQVSFAYPLLMVMVFFTVSSMLDYIAFGWEKVIPGAENEEGGTSGKA
jgi:CDP-diacylglycerol--glycerol-3-phosphate 3-phosphatidyltransferase